MNKITVGLLFGGMSAEHEVSIMSARSILNAISKEKYTVVQLGVTKEGHWLSGEKTLECLDNGCDGELFPVVMLPFPDQGRLYRRDGHALQPIASLDVIFPIIHGTYGEDGNLQGYLELMNIPYVGANVASSAVCMEKGFFKDVMRAQGLPVVETLVANRMEIDRYPGTVVIQAENRLQYPMFVKPVNLGSSIGVHRCRHQGELIEAMVDAARYSEKIAIEQGIDAWEVEVSVLGNEKEMLVSIPGEIRYTDTFYSYQAKYHDNETELLIPAHVGETTTEQIRRIAGQVFQAVGCVGMARIDFLVDKSSNQIFVNELNTIPGFTHASMYPRLWLHSGMSYECLVDRLIELAFERYESRKQTEFRFQPLK